MKFLFSKSALGLLVAGAMLSSCHDQGQSPKTGMKYNDKSNGGFQVFRKTHPAPGPGLVPVEGGTFVMGGSAGQDVDYEYNNMRKRKSVHSFYMDETEVSNTDWREYLYWIQTNYIGDRETYYNAIPDTLVWRRPLSYNEPYVDNYLRHPAFQDYPVVGVSWVQAREYCEWRTDRMNENILREQGRLATWKDNAKGNSTTAAGAAAPANAAAADFGTPAANANTTATTPPAEVTASNKPLFNTDAYLNGQYAGAGGKHMISNLNPNASGEGGKKAKRRVIREDGILKPGYRLPTEAEWEYAALGLVGNTQFENIEDGKMYPWNGMGVRSPKSKTRGLMLANFKRTSGDNAGVAGYLNDKADITAPVRAYEPNDFGLYNMAGNVNEWTEDTYRQTSFEETDDFNPFRGNQYTNKRYADADKGIYALDKFGKPIKDAAKSNKKLTWEQLQALKGNPTGTPATTTTPPATTPPAGTPPTTVAGATTAATTATGAPANTIAGEPFSADQRGAADPVNNTLYGVTTLVNDNSKVYKGGSWNDRAYWLNPATRRFMDKDDASAEIGFRCAMDFNGPAEVNPNGKPEFSVKKAKKFKAKS